MHSPLFSDIRRQIQQVALEGGRPDEIDQVDVGLRGVIGQQLTYEPELFRRISYCGYEFYNDAGFLRVFIQDVLLEPFAGFQRQSKNRELYRRRRLPCRATTGETGEQKDNPTRELHNAAEIDT